MDTKARDNSTAEAIAPASKAYAEAVAQVGEQAAREALERREVARAERAARDALAAQASAWAGD